MDVIFVNGTREEFWSTMKEIVREVIDESEAKRVAPLSKVEACNQLGISFPTLQRICKEMNLTDIYPSDISRILLKYPKYINKSNVNI
jgi:hypothetical protein